MSENDEKWLKAVTKLIRLTQEGTLQWESDSPPAHWRENENTHVRIVFKTLFKNRPLRLYEQDTVVTFPSAEQVSAALGQFALPGTTPQQRRVTFVFLQLIDDYDNTIWTFPRVTALKDLYNTVTYQVGDIKGLLNDLLDDSAAL